MKIAIVTDAWHPQTNGVVTTLTQTARCLAELGHEVRVFGPDGLRSVPLPTYSEIRLVVRPRRRLRRRLLEFQPDAVHVATEGSMGFAARRICLRLTWPFTTSYDTRYPQYVRARFPVPLSFTYALLRRFHSPSRCTMVPTQFMRRELEARSFDHVAVWSRGVDTDMFRPREKSFLAAPRPVFMYMGRVAPEKNIGSFLSLELPGSKYVVGDGPSRKTLEQRFPRTRFTGYKHGDELVAHLAAADVFVFPSRTDTFGLVLLEAMACGVPVAAYPVAGPADVVRQGVSGYLDEDLQRAALRAIDLDPGTCREEALKRSWMAATEQFVSNLRPRMRLSLAA
ncbi:MAG: glycosyltransferase family 1 protein [Chromatiales bacterium]|jgi:glycosyltransferase involved in cell wall biosynthesis|nr:glycosyltransferase family 1 protein [Chromatiales bacterium]MDH3895718.1 glycosyltransferase family 1 protein [Chromatiales bacterium]MDH3932021.1 glycosyltransferase family 1 protein [Chromatiales bacterium]MDH3947197.1 glycosyltransferase family 1 protein [Chromatiales bacterium]